MRYTKPPWRIGRLLFESERNYQLIEAGRGYYNGETGQGFGLTGFMNAGDAVLIAHAAEMYELLLKSRSKAEIELIKKMKGAYDATINR